MIEKPTFCRICEPNCPLIAEIDGNGKVQRLRADRSHPSGGVACHKGLSFLEVHNDPDRLNWPLHRKNARSEAEGRFDACGWEEAIDDIGARLKAIRDQHGPDAIAIYYGNPFGLANATAAAAIEPFREAIGTRMVFSANTQDTNNKAVGAIAVYGSSGANMIPDLRHTDFLLCLGTNPRVSRWTYMSVPNDDLAIVRGIRARGGKVRFVNPRRTESSTAETGPTLLIKPGTDVYFLAAMLHEIDVLGGFREDVIARHAKNVAGLRQFIAEYSPDDVADVTGLSPAVIRETARELVSAPSAAVYMATGVNQSRQGVLCHWLVEMINFVTGNLGRRGGSFKPVGLVDEMPVATGTMLVPTSLGDFELPDPIGYSVMPAVALPALIASGEIRALLVLGGNPLLTVGGEDDLRKAVERIDLMVSIDIFRQATGELCDYILPSTDWLEHMDLNFLSSGTQETPYIQYSEAMEKPAAGRRNSWWTLARILQASGLPSPLDADPEADDGHMVIAGLLSMRGLSVDALLALPANTLMLDPEPYDSLYETCLVHPDRKIDCCPPMFAEKGLIGRARTIFGELRREPPDQLKLISLRTRYMHNSWLVNAGKFRRGRNAVNPLHMSQADAESRNLHDGDAVRVSNRYGSIDTEIVIDDALRAGVVAMSHGYGHRRSFGLHHARRKPGVNCNKLMPTDVGTIEPVSHMSWLSGVPVDVAPLP